MKNRFLKELNRGLTPLNKEERSRYVNNYEEIISDKIESGIAEESAVAELGSAKLIAKEILDSYTDNNALLENIRYINKVYLVLDVILLFFSFILSYYLYFKRTLFKTNIGINHLELSYYIKSILFIIPTIIILYYLFKVYTITYLIKISLVIRDIIISNIIGFMIIMFWLFIFRSMDYSRFFLVVFTFINVILDILTRILLFIYTNRQ